VALVTSRRTRRWVLPKGWPMDGATPSEAAAREAYEEAGLEGRTVDVCLGIYSYTKALEDEGDVPCVVAIFPLKVKRVLRDWPEAKQRKRKWFSTKKAATLVDMPELKRILREFDPFLLPR
ncbi:MAG: NUDIX hydrolase, partial [Rhodobacteraceae bacterium]|nr:NUDIX hydrolase [Paracoccaceae bacterium]